MRTGLFILSAALVAAAFAGDAPRAAPAPCPEIRVYFSPRGGCTDALVDLIGTARHRVRVQAYSFTSRPIADALLAAHRRGVAVDILLDGGQRRARSCAGPRLAAAGVPVRYDAAHAIAHNKVIVVDGHTVATGSFNYSAAAEAVNAENVAIIRDPPTAAAYIAHWEAHRRHATP